MSRTQRFNDRVRNVVAYGNYPMATGDQPLFECLTTGTRGKISYNVLPGQLVAYVVENGVATIVDADTVDASHVHELFIGVGYDSDGDGVTNDIRHLGVEEVALCQPREVSTSSPRCGNPEIVDFYFDCTFCHETYSVVVRVDDNDSRGFGPWNKSFAEFVGSVVTTCYQCDDCPVEHNCREVACKLADALNNEFNLKIGDLPYPDYKPAYLPQPFYATRLHDSSFVFCLNPQTDDESCDRCTYVDAITGVTINGTQYDFTGTTDPGDSSQTRLAQIDNVVLQINDAFIQEYSQVNGEVVPGTTNPHAGSAFRTGSYQQCCPIQLHVNTCDDGFELLVNGQAATPTREYNPFDEYGTFSGTRNCIDCDDTPESNTYNCGLRVMAEQISGRCDCFIEKPLAFYGREIKVLPFGDGWRGKSWRTVKVQEMELPSGFGSWIQWLEYQDIPGGRGRTYSRSNDLRGWGNLPDSKSRIRNAVTARCDFNYCSYYMKTLLEKRKICNEYGVLTVHSHVHIPTHHDVTITDWEDFFSTIIGLAPGCKVLSTISCDTDFGDCADDVGATPTPTPTPSPTPSP